MALTKVHLGDIVLPYVQKCNNPNLTADDISGVNKDKEFFEPSKQAGSDTSNYKVVPPAYFACNLMHVGRDRVLPIALNHTNANKIVSPAYTVFCLTDQTLLLNEFFLMMLKSNERDRYFWFHTDTSVRDGMAWEDFCEVEVEIPSLSVQQKYVSLYYAILSELKVNIQASARMQRVCNSFVENALHSHHKMPISAFIEEIDRRNSDDEFTLDNLKGITTRKEFISTKADMNGVSLSNYKVVQPKEFAYVADTSRRGDKISLAFNEGQEPILVSSITTVFRVKDGCQNMILPEYMYLFLRRNEFDRYARYNSWGSARETISWDDFGRYQIPVVSLKQQQSIINLFHAQRQQDLSAQKLTEIQNRIGPILIAGALKEGAKS